METTFYQHLKLVVAHYIPVRAHDPYHIYIGFLTFMFAGLLLRRKYSDPICLLPGLAVAAVMEAIDLHDDFVSLGYCRWPAAIHGFVATNLLAVLLFLFVRYNKSGFA